MEPNGDGGFKDREDCYDYITSSYAQTPNELVSLFASYNTELDSETELNVDFIYT